MVRFYHGRQAKAYAKRFLRESASGPEAGAGLDRVVTHTWDLGCDNFWGAGSQLDEAPTSCPRRAAIAQPESADFLIRYGPHRH